MPEFVEIEQGKCVAKTSSSVFANRESRTEQGNGNGHHFASGARSNERKPRYDLIPLVALRREAQRMAEGAGDHGARNYQKGAGDAAFFADRLNHLIEHALAYADGDQSTDHLAAIRANAGILMWLEAHTG